MNKKLKHQILKKLNLETQRRFKKKISWLGGFAIMEFSMVVFFGSIQAERAVIYQLKCSINSNKTVGKNIQNNI